MIFSLPKNLDRINFQFDKDLNDFTDITRQYKHVTDECSISKEIWPKLKSMVSYRIEWNVRFIKESYLFNMLPHISHLKILDLADLSVILTEKLVEELKEIKGYDAVELIHLTSLTIDVALFDVLHDRYVKFSTNRLEKLKITDGPYCMTVDDVEALRSLIASQKNLKELILQFADLNRLFITPLLATGCQLKRFEVEDKRPQGFDTNQQNNLCDLVFAQKSLEHFKIRISSATERTKKMQHLMISRLDMPLV